MFILKNILICGAFFFIQNIMSAQTNSTSNSTTMEAQTIELNNENEKKISENVQLEVNDTSEPIPTPEEQGFTKFVIEGKIVYKKNIDGIIIEYKPE